MNRRFHPVAAFLFLVMVVISPAVGQDRSAVTSSSAGSNIIAQTTTQTESAPATPATPPRAPLTTQDALQMYRDKRYAAAVEETLAEIQATPRNIDSYVVLGWSLLALGRYQEALDWGTKALTVSPYDDRVIEILGEASYRLNQNQAALKYFEQYVSLAPSGNNRLIDDVYYFMAETYIRLGELNHADIALSAAIHFQPNESLYWTRLGYVREQLKEYSPALDAYQRALNLNPNLADAVAGRNRVQSLANR
ncbi:MAG TPA: tetratricopeptide repeat protein [Spirochaetia bacterium]|nr:tetratricopeptide repeat protein [Spirochaetia bacterium]